MSPNNFEHDKEKIEKEALERHERWSKEFQENRFMFERTRRLEVEKFINEAPEEQQPALRELQEKWDKALKGAGSKENRLVVAKNILMDHFVNKFQPALELIAPNNDK